jgi:hypothetical protein
MSPPPTFDDLKEDEIRILYLEPGGFDEPLTGELKTISITRETPRHTERTTASSQPQRRISFETQNSVSSASSEAGSSPRPHSSEQYEAVSYAWESLEKPDSINIRNIGEIQITHSLFDLLRHFRYTHRSRRLWVDAVCIDQANIPERNHQVAKMADIFSTSSRVLVWLGAGESADSLVFAATEVYKNLTPSDDEEFLDLTLEMIRDALCEYTGPHASFKRNLDVQENVAIRALKSIFNIFQAKWLERMWVVQETALPRQLAFFRGYHAMSGDDLWRSLHLLLKYQHATKIRYPDIRTDRRALKSMILHLLRPPHQGRGIQFFLAYSDRRCSDPRDRVYALRRVLGLENFDELRPDYRLSHVETFRRLVCVSLYVGDRTMDKIRPDTGVVDFGGDKVIGTHPVLTLALVGTEVQPRSNHSWPSWVPYLHELRDASRAKEQLYRKYDLSLHARHACFEDCWHAYGKLFSARVMPLPPNLMQLRAGCFAKAREICLVQNVPDLGPVNLSKDTTTKDHVRTVANWFVKFCCAVADCIPGVLDMGLKEGLVSFAFYPSKWTSRLPFEEPVKPRQKRGFTDLVEPLVARGIDGKVNLSRLLCNEILDLAFESPECPLTPRRRLWRVQLEGRTDVAWLPVETQAGDDICVIAGAPWPFVIRNVDEQSYTLIGDGHVFHTSLMQALGSERQEFEFWPGEPLGFNTDIHPSDEDMANLSWITLR